jgi:hypothetical protein
MNVSTGPMTGHPVTPPVAMDAVSERSIQQIGIREGFPKEMEPYLALILLRMYFPEKSCDRSGCRRADARLPPCGYDRLSIGSGILSLRLKPEKPIGPETQTVSAPGGSRTLRFFNPLFRLHQRSLTRLSPMPRVEGRLPENNRVGKRTGRSRQMCSRAHIDTGDIRPGPNLGERVGIPARHGTRRRRPPEPCRVDSEIWEPRHLVLRYGHR